MTRSVHDRIPIWAVRTLQDILVKQGLMPEEARQQLVTVPTGAPVPDGSGGKRQAARGEKFPLSAFMSRRSAYNISNRADTMTMRQQRSEGHRRKVQVEVEQIELLMLKQARMMVQGLRPELNEYGEIERAESGKQKFERIPAAVQAQTFNTVNSFAARVNPQTQKVEMEHSGEIKSTASTPEEIEEMRKAAIERIAARHAAQSSG